MKLIEKLLGLVPGADALLRAPGRLVKGAFIVVAAIIILLLLAVLL